MADVVELEEKLMMKEEELEEALMQIRNLSEDKASSEEEFKKREAALRKEVQQQKDFYEYQIRSLESHIEMLHVDSNPQKDVAPKSGLKARLEAAEKAKAEADVHLRQELDKVKALEEQLMSSQELVHKMKQHNIDTNENARVDDEELAAIAPGAGLKKRLADAAIAADEQQLC